MADGANKTLIVVLAGDHVGTLSQDRTGQLTLTYDDTWRERPGATPLSLSLPQRVHRGPVVRAFLPGGGTSPRSGSRSVPPLRFR